MNDILRAFFGGLIFFIVLSILGFVILMTAGKIADEIKGTGVKNILEDIWYGTNNISQSEQITNYKK